ncbi:hypothetical protein [Burkholderia sp. BCC0322]|nr:hypothetical protein [Burkholderia sp. BCC0322]
MSEVNRFHEGSSIEVPNALTAETLRRSEAGEALHAAHDADDLFRQLGI